MRYSYITEGEKLDKIKNLFKKHGGKIAAGLGAILAAGYAASHPEEVSHLAHAAKEKMTNAAEDVKGSVAALKAKLTGETGETDDEKGGLTALKNKLANTADSMKSGIAALKNKLTGASAEG